MKREFKFKNSYLSENNVPIAAKYSAIGYYDGMDTKVLDTKKQVSKGGSDDEALQEENFDYFNLVGMRKKEDETFWKSEELPFIFISCIRLKKKPKDLEQTVNQIEKMIANSCCYYSYGSSDLIICMRTSCYSVGYRMVERYREIIVACDSENDVQKCSSVLVVEQGVLDSLKVCTGGIVKEPVTCILSCVIKDRDKVGMFIKKIKEKLPSATCTAFGTLGTSDMLIYIEDADVVDLFRLYGSGEILTHGCKEYDAAFYNVKTEILVERKEE